MAFKIQSVEKRLETIRTSEFDCFIKHVKEISACNRKSLCERVKEKKNSQCLQAKHAIYHSGGSI